MSGFLVIQKRYWLVPFSSNEALKIVKKKNVHTIFQISTWTKFFCIKNIFIMNDVTDFRKTVETGVDRAFSDSFDTVRACNIFK